MKNLLNRLLFAFSLMLVSFVNAQTPGAGVTIDGQTYPTVIINGREWMAENLNATHWENGESFVHINNTSDATLATFVSAPITTNIQTGPYATPAYTEPSWGSANGNGKLYNFSIVYNNSAPTPKVIKTGWRIPTEAEWNAMITATNANASDNMRKVESGSENFWTCTGNFVDQFGFSAIGVGRVTVNGSTASMNISGASAGEGAFFWSVTTGEDGGTNVSYVTLTCNSLTSGTFMTADWTINRRSAVSVRLIKDAPLSTNDFDKSKVSVYPNPVKDELNIETEYNVETVQVFDLTGKTVLTLKGASNVNVSQLTNGVYILRVTTDNGILTQKLVKN